MREDVSGQLYITFGQRYEQGVRWATASASQLGKRSLWGYVHHVQCHRYLKIFLSRESESFSALSHSGNSHVLKASQGDEVFSNPQPLRILKGSQLFSTMAPNKAAKTEREKKVKELLSITSPIDRIRHQLC